MGWCAKRFHGTELVLFICSIRLREANFFKLELVVGAIPIGFSVIGVRRDCSFEGVGRKALVLIVLANLVLAIAASVLVDLVLTMTITSIAVTGLLGILFTGVYVKNLFEVSIKLSESVLVFFVEKHAFYISVVVEALIQLCEQIKLHISTFCFRHRSIATVDAHDINHRTSACWAWLNLCWCQHLKEI